jgi:hypothetical protein
VMHATGRTLEQARRALAESRGIVKKAIEQLNA